MEEKTWGLLAYGTMRRAGVNYLPPARGSATEHQGVTFGKSVIVCIQHIVMSHWRR